MVEQRPPKAKVEGSIPFTDDFYYLSLFVANDETIFYMQYRNVIEPNKTIN
jgi:hypothetical protein